MPSSRIRIVEWQDNAVVMIDQRLLPQREVYRVYRNYQGVARAIRTMVVRGAPAIGVAAAMGIALGVRAWRSSTAIDRRFETICAALAATRPTAVNLFWAIARMRACFASNRHRPLAALQAALLKEARNIHAEDIASNRRMGRFGAVLLPRRGTVMTHCNAGALATAGYGTALGVIRAAREAGKRIDVIANETRPFLQGARLTAWELLRDGVPTTLITDNMAGHILSTGQVSCIVVGADRVAANGDAANKIGTYTLAVLAARHSVPFYVAAPLSTVDFDCPDGTRIPIEERTPSEVTDLGGRRIAARGVAVRNPAFDVTPNELIGAIITEQGVARAPFVASLARLRKAAARSRASA